LRRSDHSEGEGVITYPCLFRFCKVYPNSAASPACSLWTAMKRD
jgi:hypothetical protein